LLTLSTARMKDSPAVHSFNSFPNARLTPPIGKPARRNEAEAIIDASADPRL